MSGHQQWGQRRKGGIISSAVETRLHVRSTFINGTLD